MGLLQQSSRSDRFLVMNTGRDVVRDVDQFEQGDNHSVQLVHIPNGYDGGAA